MEFGTAAFGANGPGVEPLDASYNLEAIEGKNRDFSNPMYECSMGGNGSGIYEVPSEAPKKVPLVTCMCLLYDAARD